MDLALVKTFLEVADSGSFVSASERLFVTQSAVSLRVQRLEDQLGRPLFIRAKTGAELTPAGQKFKGFAQEMLRNWEEVRLQVAASDGIERNLTIGAEASLWPRLGFRWVDALRDSLPGLALRAQVGSTETINRSMTEGTMQIALAYHPPKGPGLFSEKVLDEELVLVAPWPDAVIEDLPKKYAFVEWSKEFRAFHDGRLPQLTNSRLTLDMGVLAAQFIIYREIAAYLPARYVKRYIDEKRLHLVVGAPTFSYPIWSVWRDDLDDDIADVARKSLAIHARKAWHDTTELLSEI